MSDKTLYLHGTLIDDDTLCTLTELCRLCCIESEAIMAMIEEGLITPLGQAPADWRFGSGEIRRIKTAIRLQRDLRVNLPGCALALDLLEELEQLRRLVRSL
jgi:chaperone modulatory protein CbpM